MEEFVNLIQVCYRVIILGMISNAEYTAFKGRNQTNRNVKYHLFSLFPLCSSRTSVLKLCLFMLCLFMLCCMFAAADTDEQRHLRMRFEELPPRILQQRLDRERSTVQPTIPGLMEAQTQRFIERYSKPAGLKWLAEVLRSGAPYMAFIRSEIEARGMPPELLYLPVIESGFEAKAKSSSGAAGFWQFMSNSIKPYMVIDNWVDERLDFWKSTHGALSKLQSNYNDYNDWALALAAYNSGSGAINRVIKETGIHDYWQLAYSKKLKTESIYYVPKLIAIYYIASNPRQFGLPILEPANEYNWSRVYVDKQINLLLLAEFAGIDQNELMKANSEIKHYLTPPGGHLLKVRSEYVDAVQAVLDNADLQLLKSDTPLANAAGWNSTWVVQKGDTLWSISRYYNITVADLAAINGIEMNAILSIGQKIKVP
ncbi:MAG: hypothetical protein Ta2G_03360 [Termitinemataceae bacterium]|nr:MAG: hypothetical protein Ta2G_03360 [Termitinemataceae bacterium]